MTPQQRAEKNDQDWMVKKQRPGVLRARFYRTESDIMFVWPPGRTKSDAYLLSSIFSDDSIKRLSSAGYDITTLSFSIRLRNSPEKETSP